MLASKREIILVEHADRRHGFLLLNRTIMP
jgi:hypothetical protein